MNWLITFLQDLLKPFDEEDRAFIMRYWETVFGISTNFYQKLLETEVDRNIQTVLDHHKEFCHGYSFEDQVTEYRYEVEHLPCFLDSSASNMRFLGPRVHVSRELQTPWRIPTYAENLSISGASSSSYENREGIIVSTTDREQSLWVEYEDREIQESEVERDGIKLTGPATLQEIVYQGTKSNNRQNGPRIRGIAEVLSDGSLYDPMRNFLGIHKYALYKCASIEARLTEVIDAHTFRIDPLHHAVGEKVAYELDAYPFCYEIEGRPIFPGLNYAIEDGLIGFVELPQGTLEAEEVQFDNSNPFRTLLSGPADIRTFKAVWASVFLGARPESLNLMLHALMGLPWVDPIMGKIRIDELEYEYTWSGSSVDMMVSNKKVTTTVDYFAPDQTAIKIDRKFHKIRRILSRQSCLIDSTLEDGSYIGSAGDFVFKNMLVTDRFGYSFPIAVPENTCPLFGPDEYADIWSRLTTGVRVYDRTMVEDYINDVDISRFIAGPSYDPVKAQKRLVANTFVIEYDVAGLNLDYYKICIPGWTEYIERNNIQEDRVYIYEAMSVFPGYILWLGKMFGSMDFSPRMVNVRKLYENAAVTDESRPQQFSATYIESGGQYILRDPNVGGTPISLAGDIAVDLWTSDLWAYTDTPYFIETYLIGTPDEMIIDRDIPGLISGTAYDFVIMSPTAMRMETANVFIDEGGSVDGFVIGRHMGNIGYSAVPYYPYFDPISGYVPGLYGLGDFSMNERKHIDAQNVSVNAGIMIDLDYQRRGVKRGMTAILSGLNTGSLFEVQDFTANGEVLLNPAPIDDINLDIDIYAFALRHNDGSITTFGE